jgi:hypothetical protein
MNALNLPTPHQCQIQNLPQPSSYRGGNNSGSDSNSRNAGEISSPEVPIQSDLSPIKGSPFKLTPQSSAEKSHNYSSSTDG